MNTTQRISDLKKQLEAIYSVMPKTFRQQQLRDKAAFEISKQLEKLENPISYAQNNNFWDLHELRF